MSYHVKKFKNGNYMRDCGHTHRSETSARRCARSEAQGIFDTYETKVVEDGTERVVAHYSNQEKVSTSGSTLRIYSKVREVV